MKGSLAHTCFQPRSHFAWRKQKPGSLARIPLPVRTREGNSPYGGNVRSAARRKRPCSAQSTSTETTAAQSTPGFAFSTQELSAIAEDLLDGDKQGISNEKLLEGLGSSSQKGLADSGEQAIERKKRFGENRLPSRAEVRSSLQGTTLS